MMSRGGTGALEVRFGRCKELESQVIPAILCRMPVDLPLQEMSFQDKLGLLEALWDDLSRSPEKLLPPEWHKEVLDERRQRVQSGEEIVSDWETAKHDMKKRLRAKG